MRCFHMFDISLYLAERQFILKSSSMISVFCAYDFITIVRWYSVSRPGDIARRVRAKWQRAHLDGNRQETLWNAMEFRPGELSESIVI